MFEMRPASIKDIINSTIKMLSGIIGEDIELRTNLTDKNITITADVAQIENVLMNLAVNAKDAMPEGGVLTISTDLVHLDEEITMSHGFGQAGTFAVITVTDTGIGMDEQTIRKIYDPHFTTKEIGKETGLGLFIVSGIVKQHNGFIDAVSKPFKGTTFKIHLPAIESGGARTKSAKAGKASGCAATILLVEDDDAVRKLMRIMLEGHGYNVIEAVDGEDGMEKFLAHKDSIQLVILDVIMPRGNGRQVYDEIRKIRPEIKAIFISGYTEDILQKNAMIEEGIQFLPKPVPISKLSSKIRELLDK